MSDQDFDCYRLEDVEVGRICGVLTFSRVQQLRRECNQRVYGTVKGKMKLSNESDLHTATELDHQV